MFEVIQHITLDVLANSHEYHHALHIIIMHFELHVYDALLVIREIFE